ncbi:hypothetical protein [Candidatus Nitronereus thalassa]|uniref:Uncharacterized protein n=1 Tax=Candidatus Nitronereus thalassa TaxID=3020898 RepID=A0ABU3K4M9_9BACT|nr:hypothetical protein [Candidatus Nitronereus thalassa]MDT7041315.1 hypothetical protein [Candidatus Nitronereus thalassa]
MKHLSPTAESLLSLSSRILILPIRNGSSDVAQEIRDLLLSQRVDCLAVGLPPSVESLVEEGIERLPQISLVVLPEPVQDEEGTCSYIPIDPCQPIIMALRVAMGEGIDRAFIDREVIIFKPWSFPFPDSYALKQISLPIFAGAMLPFMPYPKPESQRWERIKWMAFKLHELELDYSSIVCLCPIEDWPWLRDAYQQRWAYTPHEPSEQRPFLCTVEPSTLYFTLCELPFLTELFEQRRMEARSDEHLSLDGIKELLLETRTRWLAKRAPTRDQEGNWVTPQLLQMFLQYVRNLTLLEHRLTPDLYTLVLAAKQMAGDDFAITLLDTAKTYVYQEDQATGYGMPNYKVGIEQLESPDGQVSRAKNRLQGSALAWRSLSLKPAPTPQKKQRWAYRWNPFGQCSWPPEDDRIEGFTAHVREQAKAVLGADLAQVDKFTTSIRDGIDMRETLRHWNPKQGNRLSDIYVKDIPPSRGNVEIVVFLFEVPADPAQFSWQATWYAEHAQESTLCFYATPFLENMVGPGIGQSQYGGTFFQFPPRPLPNVWEDPRLDFAESIEDRLIAGAAMHSQEKHVALVSPIPPLARWKKIARKFDRKLIPIPLSRFSGQTVHRLRHFHVLNGHEIRSFASQFIQG